MGRKRTFDAGSATAGSISTAKTMKATFSAHFISLWSLVLRIPRPRVEPVPHPKRTRQYPDNIFQSRRVVAHSNGRRLEC